MPTFHEKVARHRILDKSRATMIFFAITTAAMPLDGDIIAAPRHYRHIDNIDITGYGRLY